MGKLTRQEAANLHGAASSLARRIEKSSRDRGRTEVATVVDTSFYETAGYIYAQVGSSVVKVICRSLENVAVGQDIFVRQLSADRWSWWLYDGFAQGADGATTPIQNPTTVGPHGHSHTVLTDVLPDQHHAQSHNLGGPDHQGNLDAARVTLGPNVGSHGDLQAHVSDSEIHGVPYGFVQVRPTGAIDGNNTAFSVGSDYATGTLRVFYKPAGETGFLRLERGDDFTEVPQGFVMQWAPAAGDELFCDLVADTATVPPSSHAESHKTGQDRLGWNDLPYMSAGDTTQQTAKEYIDARDQAVTNALASNLDDHVGSDLHHLRPHDLDSDEDHVGSLSDQKVRLTYGNVGGHESLYGHVFDETLHNTGSSNWTRKQMAELRPRPTDPPSMSVSVEAGTGVVPAVGSVKFAGGTQAFVAPADGSRIDLLCLLATNGLSVVQGIASQTPIAPDYPNDRLVIAEVMLTAGMTAIGPGEIADVRPFQAFPLDLGYLPPTSQDDTVNPLTPPGSLEGDLNQIRAAIRAIKNSATSWLTAPVASLQSIYTMLTSHINDNTRHGAGGPWFVRGGPRWYVPGALAPGLFPVPQQVDNSGTIERFRCRVGSPPSGAPLTIAVKRGATLVGTCTINAGYQEGETTSFGANATVQSGYEYTVEITGVGLDSPGRDLIAELVIKLSVTSS